MCKVSFEGFSFFCKALFAVPSSQGRHLQMQKLKSKGICKKQRIASDPFTKKEGDRISTPFRTI